MQKSSRGPCCSSLLLLIVLPVVTFERISNASLIPASGWICPILHYMLYIYMGWRRKKNLSIFSPMYTCNVVWMCAHKNPVPSRPCRFESQRVGGNHCRSLSIVASLLLDSIGESSLFPMPKYFKYLVFLSKYIGLAWVDISAKPPSFSP